MFWNKKEPESALETRAAHHVEQVRELRKEKQSLLKDINAHKETIASLKRQAAEAEHKRKLEDEETRHLIRLREEKLELDFDRKNMDRETKKANEIAKIREEYRDKIEKGLERRSDELREMYTEILGRLPNVNVMLGEEQKKPATRARKK